MIRIPFHSRICSIIRSEGSKSFGIAVIVGLLITLGQIGLVVVICDKETVAECWCDGLFEWDSQWFYTIAEQGYVKPAKIDEVTPGNFAFLPGFPLLSRFVSDLTGLKLQVSMILTAQLCCWGLWTYFLLFLREARVSRAVGLFAAGSIVLHPVSFFLIAAYTESLFLFSVFGFIYWIERRGPVALMLAGIHGFAITSTRLVGVSLIGYPLIRAVIRRNWERNDEGSAAGMSYGAALLLAVVSAGGFTSYLGYCQWKFGDWYLFAISQKFGWGTDPYPLALLDPRVFYDTVTIWNHVTLDPFALNALCAAYCFLLLIGLAVAEIACGRKARLPGLRWRIGIYMCAMLLFALPYTSHARLHLLSFSRFSLPVLALLALAGARLAAESGLEKKWRWLPWVLGALILLSAVANGLMTMRFTSGQWVA